MAWVVVDEDGLENICSEKPYRKYNCVWQVSRAADVVFLPSGSIKKLIGRELSWSDEPVELKED